MNNILHLPHQDRRVESGTIQFGDDWPGVFIRGDQAAYLAMHLRDNIEGNVTPLSRAVLIGLYETLRGCVLGPAADLFPEVKR